MARRPDPEKPDVLNEEELKQLRHNLAHLSPGGVREFCERDLRGLPTRLQPTSQPPQDSDTRSAVEMAIVSPVPSLHEKKSK
jgi:hypothetical protein